MQPSFYPEKPSSVTFRETHISRVYILDRHVYKMKKPVNLGFLDFSSLERRRFFCEEEVRLNSRFSTDTYLCVVPVCRDNGGLHIGLPGETVEYLVKMRRLPEELMLSRRLEEQKVDLHPEMARIARHLADLHISEPVSNHDEGYSDLMHIRRNWEENFSQTMTHIESSISPDGFAALRSYVKRFLEDHEELIDQRERDGWVRECHGDLHAEHICLTDPVRIYDCIEFNRRFRVSDILADIAFLLMDIDCHGRYDLSDALWQAYLDRLAAPAPEELVRFYKVYRAYVRGKVAAISGSEPEVSEDLRGKAWHSASGYFNLALGYILPPALLITCGLMGTGKSSLAAELATALRAELIRSDLLRLQFKNGPGTGEQAAYMDGAYRSELTEKVYGQMAEQAREHLKAGRTVILDASFANAGHRHSMQQLAAGCSVPFAVLYCQCSRETALMRLYGRMQEGTDVSDGRVELYDIQRIHFETPTDNEPVIEIKTSGRVDYTVNRLLGRMPAIIGETGLKKQKN